ncbi:hypothetical protein T459_01585 [Capsicum annuum]|uniref:Uncharacterized protein n=1 Tax=Capsicum annuum TaxID=4072 RepID=A0A1U8GXV5_CAPAN|nr:anther-specific proline-rich protein APG isoform X2 [Capsicum annuum]KAF3636568.1 cryptochrome 2 (photolyase-like) [Capsicum annuum]PHT93703.1 hypothetical protein T459_01585 [Capsicum annuum]
MAIMKMLMMLVVAAILFCSHHQVTKAQDIALVTTNDESDSLSSSPFDILCQYWPWPYPWPRPCPPPRPRPRPRPCAPPPPPPCSPPPRSPPPPPPPRSPPPRPAMSCSSSDKQKVQKCFNETVSIDECCPTFQNILGKSCPCYQYAEDLDNQVLITAEAYCDFSTPCKGVPPPPPKSPPPRPTAACSASDKLKVQKCFNETVSIDACCPTFQSILGKSCLCYQYAEELDNQVLITAEAYCDFGSPCKGVQVIKLSKDE